MLLDVIGWIAAAFGMSAAVPQLYRLWKVHTSAGLSERMWQLNTAAVAAWAMHGFYFDRMQLGIPNIVCVIIYVGVLWFIASDRGKKLAPMLLLPAIGGLLLFGVDLWLGEVVFGFVVAAPLVYGQLSQLRVMVKSADLSGVSVPTLAVNVLVQLLWAVWGFGVGDGAMMVCSVLMASVCIANVGYYTWRRMRGTAGPVAETEAAAAETSEALA